MVILSPFSGYVQPLVDTAADLVVSQNKVDIFRFDPDQAEIDLQTATFAQSLLSELKRLAQSLGEWSPDFQSPNVQLLKDRVAQRFEIARWMSDVATSRKNSQAAGAGSQAAVDLANLISTNTWGQKTLSEVDLLEWQTHFAAVDRVLLLLQHYVDGVVKEASFVLEHHIISAAYQGKYRINQRYAGHVEKGDVLATIVDSSDRIPNEAVVRSPAEGYVANVFCANQSAVSTGQKILQLRDAPYQLEDHSLSIAEEQLAACLKRIDHDDTNTSRKRLVMRRDLKIAERNYRRDDDARARDAVQVGARNVTDVDFTSAAYMNAGIEVASCLQELSDYDAAIVAAKKMYTSLQKIVGRKRELIAKRISQLEVVAPHAGTLNMLIAPDSFVMQGTPLFAVAK
jgi:biotin carboxyl carrier protein